MWAPGTVSNPCNQADLFLPTDLDLRPLTGCLVRFGRVNFYVVYAVMAIYDVGKRLCAFIM